MSILLLDMSMFADTAYGVSRITLRVASVLFLAYVLTIGLALILTWRPGKRPVADTRPAEQPLNTLAKPLSSHRKRAIEPDVAGVRDSNKVFAPQERKAAPTGAAVNEPNRKEAQK